MHISDFIYNTNYLIVITYVYVTKVQLNKNIWKRKGSGYYQNVYSGTDFQSRYFWSTQCSELKLI